MTEFLVFGRHFLASLHHVRGVLITLSVALLGCAAFMASVEDRDFGEALYFTLITGLTVGYGDITPATTGGRVVSVLCGVIGILFTGIVVAVAVRALRESVDEIAAAGRVGEGDR